MTKSADAFRTISEVAEDVDLPQHVLRFWETRFPQIKPLKRAGGRRFYRPADVQLLVTIRRLLYDEGYTIKGVQRLLRERGARAGTAPPGQAAEDEPDAAKDAAKDAIGDDQEALAETALDATLDANPERDEAGDIRAAEPDPDMAPEPDMSADPARRAPRIDAGDLGRLRAALDVITACEDILRAALRPAP